MFKKGDSVKIKDEDSLFYWVDSFEDNEGTKIGVLAGLGGEDFMYAPVSEIVAVADTTEQKLLNVMTDISSLLRMALREGGIYEARDAREHGCGECENCGCDLSEEGEEDEEDLDKEDKPTSEEDEGEGNKWN